MNGILKEVVAKLLCQEKSMILRTFESGSQAATTHPTRSTPSGSVEDGLKGPRKGDFNGQMSFASTSKTKTTNKQIRDLLPAVLEEIASMHKERPDLIVAAWPELIGEKLAQMTKAVSFEKGVLMVKVNNSTLYSLLAQHERARLVRLLRKKFPAVVIKNIYFRIG